MDSPNSQCGSLDLSDRSPGSRQAKLTSMLAKEVLNEYASKFDGQLSDCLGEVVNCINSAVSAVQASQVKAEQERHTSMKKLFSDQSDAAKKLDSYLHQSNGSLIKLDTATLATRLKEFEDKEQKLVLDTVEQFRKKTVDLGERLTNEVISRISSKIDSLVERCKETETKTDAAVDELNSFKESLHQAVSDELSDLKRSVAEELSICSKELTEKSETRLSDLESDVVFKLQALKRDLSSLFKQVETNNASLKKQYDDSIAEISRKALKAAKAAKADALKEDIPVQSTPDNEHLAAVLEKNRILAGLNRRLKIAMTKWRIDYLKNVGTVEKASGQSLVKPQTARTHAHVSRLEFPETAPDSARQPPIPTTIVSGSSAPKDASSKSASDGSMNSVSHESEMVEIRVKAESLVYYGSMLAKMWKALEQKDLAQFLPAGITAQNLTGMSHCNVIEDVLAVIAPLSKLSTDISPVSDGSAQSPVSLSHVLSRLSTVLENACRAQLDGVSIIEQMAKINHLKQSSVAPGKFNGINEPNSPVNLRQEEQMLNNLLTRYETENQRPLISSGVSRAFGN